MISVCIATHNGEKYIKEQILSILCQLSIDDEIVVSDDGSSDNTVDIIRGLNDSRIKIIKKSPLNRKGFSAKHYLVTDNFENALMNAKGDYIFLADQDDVWEDNKVRVVLPYLKIKHLIQSNYSVIDKTGKIIENKYYLKSPISSFFFLNMLKQPFHGCCMAFPRDILNIALPFPKNLIMHDNWIGLIALVSGYKVDFIDRCLVKYRRHDINVSPAKSLNPLWFKIKYRIILLIQLFKRTI